MHWQLTLALLAFLGGFYSARWFVTRDDKRAINDIYKHVGVESAHVRPVRDDDGRLIGFVRESRDG